MEVLEWGSREALVARFFGLWKRLSRKSSLVDGNVDGFGKTAVSRHDVSNLECDHISRDNISRFYLVLLPIAPNTSLRGQGVHEGLERISSATFLVKANGRVDQKEGNDANEVFPIWRETSTI